jgi:hypothetical protein
MAQGIWTSVQAEKRRVWAQNHEDAQNMGIPTALCLKGPAGSHPKGWFDLLKALLRDLFESEPSSRFSPHSLSKITDRSTTRDVGRRRALFLSSFFPVMSDDDVFSET